ncbi:MAG: F0F1 ATP synthase subunit B [Candidatus Pacebacteria bacterium]|nr:F0F1 ATP synthase subunit B [Candidatus Paceibacterota bacterium]
MELLEALGLNLKILLAQLVNFAVLFFVLWKFAYKPIFKMLEERRNKIAKGVKDADKAEDKLKEAKVKEQELINAAKKEALQIIEEARERAEAKKQSVIDKTKEEIGQIINAEKEKIQQEKADTLKSIKADVSELVILAVEKVLQEKLAGAKDEELVAKAIKGLK